MFDYDFVDRFQKAIRRHFKSINHNISFEEKSKNDFVSSVDEGMQDFLQSYLKKVSTENIGFLGEESTHINSEPDLSESGSYWVVDPIDGTSNFLYGIPSYSVAIALISGNEVEESLVVDLSSDDFFWAVKDKGAYYKSYLINVELNKKSDLIGLSTGFIDYCVQYSPDILKDIRMEGKYRVIGSQALHLCYVACGRLKACVNREAKIWDDCAGMLIITEAGGIYKALETDLVITECFKSQKPLFSVAGNGEGKKVVDMIQQRYERIG